VTDGMTLWAAVLLGAACVSLAMLGFWFYQRRTHNAGIVDVVWATCVGALGLWFCWVGDGLPERRMLVAAVIGVWSARLTFYLFQRVTGMAEDGRYLELKEKWGDKTQRNLFLFFQVQAIWSVLFALPLLPAVESAAPLGWLDALGVAIAAVALGGEALADRQLHAFRSDPNSKGRVCKRGLWRYSRHPNYFFEWIHWWAYVAFGALGPYGWATLGGPALILFFLLKVTGIPPTEEHLLNSRGDAYREYQRTTSVFFPWPPKEASS